jgi:hypothetical protein
MLPPDDDVCRPAVTANYTGAAGFVHLSFSIQVGWGNLGLILFQVLLLAVVTDRTPVLAGEHANSLRRYFELTPKVRFLSVPQPGRPDDVHIGRKLSVSGRPINTTFKMSQIAADIASVVERPLDSSSAIAVSPVLWPSQVVHGLLEHAWHLGRLVEHSSCLAPAFLFPKTKVSREVRRAAGGATAVHVRTCQPGGGSKSTKSGNSSAFKDTCARNNREILTWDDAAAAAVAAARSQQQSAHPLFLAADAAQVFTLVRASKWHAPIRSFETLGRLTNYRYKPASFEKVDMDRIVYDWMAPVYAAQIIEINPSSFWPASLCLFNPHKALFLASAFLPTHIKARRSNSSLHQYTLPCVQVSK